MKRRNAINLLSRFNVAPVRELLTWPESRLAAGIETIEESLGDAITQETKAACYMAKMHLDNARYAITLQKQINAGHITQPIKNA